MASTKVINLRNIALCCYVVLTIAFFPSLEISDKLRYKEFFLHIASYYTYSDDDKGWYYYILLISKIYHSSTLFFLITALLYVFGYYMFVKTYIPKRYAGIFLIAVFGSLGFLNCGVNTMKSGFGLSLLLLSLVNKDRPYLFYFFAVLACSMHKSMIIPLGFIILAQYIRKTNIFMLFWIFMFILSALNTTFLNDYILDTFINFDYRVQHYLAGNENTTYKTGFRIDFLLYSIVPIVLGWWYIYKKKYSDVFYTQLYNAYLGINGFWLLVIRIPFTDRFAYLSWFLIPFLLLYPLFTEHIQFKQKVQIVTVVLGLVLVTFYVRVI
jgi:hypothetical protein